MLAGPERVDAAWNAGFAGWHCAWTLGIADIHRVRMPGRAFRITCLKRKFVEFGLVFIASPHSFGFSFRLVPLMTASADRASRGWMHLTSEPGRVCPQKAQVSGPLLSCPFEPAWRCRTEITSRSTVTSIRRTFCVSLSRLAGLVPDGSSPGGLFSRDFIAILLALPDVCFGNSNLSAPRAQKS